MATEAQGARRRVKPKELQTQCSTKSVEPDRVIARSGCATKLKRKSQGSKTRTALQVIGICDCYLSWRIRAAAARAAFLISVMLWDPGPELLRWSARMSALAEMTHRRLFKA
jgi:hypothetical protein